MNKENWHRISVLSDAMAKLKDDPDMASAVMSAEAYLIKRIKNILDEAQSFRSGRLHNLKNRDYKGLSYKAKIRMDALSDDDWNFVKRRARDILSRPAMGISKFSIAVGRAEKEIGLKRDNDKMRKWSKETDPEPENDICIACGCEHTGVGDLCAECEEERKM